MGGKQLFLERSGGVCVRDGHKGNPLVFVHVAEIGNASGNHYSGVAISLEKKGGCCW